MAANTRGASGTTLNGLLIVVLALSAIHFRRQNRSLRAHFAEHVKSQAGVEVVAPIFPGAARIDYCDDPGEACEIHDSSGAVIGAFLCSSPYCDDIKGYAGSVPLIVALDSAHRIKTVVPLKNNETGTFMARLRREGFFEKWTGVAIDDAAAKQVDAVGGATMSSEAFIESVRKRAALYTQSESTGRTGRGFLVRQILAVLFVLPGFCAAFMPGLGRKYRTFVLTSNVIVLGFVTGTALSLAFIQGIALHGFNLARQWHLLVLAAATLTVGFFTGKNVYCGFVCPYGSAQELGGKVLPKRHIRLPHALRTVYHYGRTVFLLLVFVAALTLPQFDPSLVEPFSAFIFRAAPLSAIIVAVLFVLLSIVRPRLWCGVLCPTGKLLDMLRLRHRK